MPAPMMPPMPLDGPREALIAWAAAVEALALALPDMSEAEIDAQPEDDLTQMAAIQQAYMSILCARNNALASTMEAAMIKFASEFPPEIVAIARAKLDALAKLASH